MKKITQLPTPPTSTDSANFSPRADKFVASLPNFVVEINELSDEINGTLDTITKNLNSAKEQIKETTSEAKTQMGENWQNLKLEITTHLEEQINQTKTQVAQIVDENKLDLAEKIKNMASEDVLRAIDSSKSVQVVNGVIDISKGDYFVLDMRTPVSLSITNEPSKEAAPFYSFILEVINADRYSLTWLPNTIWEKNVAPTFNSSTRSIFSFIAGDGDIVGVRVAQDLNPKGTRARNESI